MSMKCKEFKLPGFDRPVFVHHNVDWTGTAIVEWWEDTFRRAEIPARLLLLLSFSMTDHWVLAGLAGSNKKGDQEP